MTKKLCAIAIAVGALTWATPAMAGVGSGGAGGAQIGAQIANTQQGAVATAVSNQNAVNANVPVSIAGGNVTAGPSSATQNASSSAEANASNDADTNQTQTQTQNVGGSSCSVGCGGAVAAQIGAQVADTQQGAESTADSHQNAVNANVPVSIAGGNVTGGPSSADQTANSEAEANASNDADTNQTQNQNQNVGGSSSCHAGCGGAGGFQAGIQLANTQQWSDASADSHQNAVNANVPVSIAGGDIYAGPSSADQTANSEAEANASNDADTNQSQTQTQNVGGGSSCFAGCGGAGAAQIGVQHADTHQWADATAFSDQNAVNTNAPVSVAGGDIYAGPSSATQNASSEAEANASNDADTTQRQTQTQTVGGSPSCKLGCGGPGAFQLGIQKAETDQWASADANSLQNAVNGNTPHSIAGGDIYAGPSSADQSAESEAEGEASNDADTNQAACQDQRLGW